MRRLLACLLCTVLLCGCSYKTEDSSVFPVVEGADPFEVTAHYTFEVVPEGVRVYCGGERVQLLEADTADLLSFDDPEGHLTYKDFDFDLYSDLFVPELLGRPNIPGKYFHYDTETGLFETWEEMNEIRWLSAVNDTDRTLTLTVTGSAVDHKTTVYEWQEDALTELWYEVQYERGGEVFIDNYTYANGNEELVYRERVLFSEDGDWLGTEKVTVGDITDTQGQKQSQ